MDTTYSNLPSENIDNSTPRPSRTRSIANLPDSTPKRAPRAQADVFGSPTPKKSAAQFHIPPLPAETSESGPVFGVTLSYLRRVQVLADLARRVVDQAAHERDKVLRHAEKSAREKYEASRAKLQSEGSKATAGQSGAASTSRSSKTSPRAMPSVASSTPTEPASTASTKASHSTSSTSQKRSQPSSTYTSTSTASKSKHPRTEPLTPAETARRAAYHAKQSKLHAEDIEKRSARTKRLFEAALRALVNEGEATLHEGPKRAMPASGRGTGGGKRALSGMWTDVTNTTAGSSGRSLTAASSVLSGVTCSDLDTASEDDKDTPDLSDPSDSEDAYIPITPHTLRPALLAALRRTSMRHRGGVDVVTLTRALRGDEQWARVSDQAVKEALDVLYEEEWVTKVGGGRWEFTRGSWAKSLTIS